MVDTDGIIEQLYDAALEPGALPDALESLAQLVDAHSAVLIIHDPRRGTETGFCSRRADPRLVCPEVLQQARDCPWNRAARLHPPGTLLLTDELASPRELRATSFFKHVVEPLHLEHGMGCVFDVDGEVLAHVLTHRSARQGPFAPAAVSRYQELIPHLERVCRLSISLARARGTQESALAALHWLRSAVVVVDAERRVRFANRSAERVLASGTGLARRDGRLAARDVGEHQALERLIAAVAGGHQPGSGITVTGRDGRLIELVVLPMQTMVPLAGPTGATALVLFRNPELRSRGLETLLQQLYQLTPTEARVARAVMRGQGLKQAAESLGIGVTTARTHLCRVFEKTRTNRQAELVRLLLDGPAMLCGLEGET